MNNAAPQALAVAVVVRKSFLAKVPTHTHTTSQTKEGLSPDTKVYIDRFCLMFMTMFLFLL